MGSKTMPGKVGWLPLSALAIGLCVGGPATDTVAGGADVRDIAHYPGALERPIGEKISLGSEAILSWQHRINKKYGMNVRPIRASVTNPLVGLTRRMIAGLPRAVRDLASRYVVALYLLEKDFGTGTTEAVRGRNGDWSYGYIALNLTALQRTANGWGSWKESSAFRPEEGHQIRMVLEHPAQDTQQAAIRFIFLHELGHVLGLGLKAHGFWDAEKLLPATEHSPFVRRSWRGDGHGKMVPRQPGPHRWFSKLHFYRFEKGDLYLSSAEKVYRALAASNFPSLYGTTNLYDDFAEAFAIYTHTRILAKPYRVGILRGGKERFVYRSCIQTGGCPKKVEYLQALLGPG